jgi:hypothetical protein
MFSCTQDLCRKEEVGYNSLPYIFLETNSGKKAFVILKLNFTH